MSKTLPPYGDAYLGDNPWAVRTDEIILYYTGQNTSAVFLGTDVDSDDVVVGAGSVASESTYDLWVLPAGATVYGLWASVCDSFGADSDGLDCTIGDTAGADTWFTDTQLICNLSTTGIMTRASATAGKFYDTGATISVTCIHSTSGLASGLIKFVMKWSMAR